jgi:B-block binding subunit of TFIIIC
VPAWGCMMTTPGLFLSAASRLKYDLHAAPQTHHALVQLLLRHSAQHAVCRLTTSVEVATCDDMQRQALERIGRARSAGLLQSVTASEMGISAASFFFIVKVLCRVTKSIHRPHCMHSSAMSPDAAHTMLTCRC